MTTTTQSEFAPALAALKARMDRELSPRPRVLCGAWLVFTLTGALGLMSMWMTEPAPLPARTHVAFAFLLLIDLVWVAFFARMLMVRGLNFARQRVVGGTVAVVATVGWVGMTTALAAVRDAWVSGMPAVATALTLSVLAWVLRRNAVRETERLEALEQALQLQSE